jgi:cation diffusion facilitator CzcD-associated flavoprotein CzcO/acetyl esterase/lipase
MQTTNDTAHNPTNVDVVVVGAGFAGLYATHRLRNVLGLRVRSFEAGSGPGGTWYWNRYPGARCDIESYNYSYSFDEALQREWRWSERFAAQPEILAYLEHVADRFDLRRSYTFETRVTSAVWDDAGNFWTVGTDAGEKLTTRFIIAGSGVLSTAQQNEFPGLGDFEGDVLRTAAWPHEGYDFTGKRVAVIGTGSSGLQVIPEVARDAAHLTVFQRTPQYAIPLGNRPTFAHEHDEIVNDYAAIRAASRLNFVGAPYPEASPSALAVDEETRKAIYDKYYDGGGFRMLVSTFGDLLHNKEANDTVSEYIRDRITERVEDPVVADLLSPKGYAYATKRAPFEYGYFETFNQENVELVDVQSTPIRSITATGVETSAQHFGFDVIVMATGFDAITGSLLRMGLIGRNGAELAARWADGPHTYLGIAVPDFPNLFMITGPQSPSVIYNMPLAIEDHVEFASAAIEATLGRGADLVEATAQAGDAWQVLVSGIADATLMTQTASWYMGANIPGKPRAALLFVGGAPLYRAICAEVEATGFGGFRIGEETAPLPSSMLLDPKVATVLGLIMLGDARSYEQLSVEEQRAMLESFVLVQAPPRQSVKFEERTYPTAAAEHLNLHLPVRIYHPDAKGPLPVVVLLHPGGWVGGSIALSHAPSTELAEELGAVVVTPSYRLAPEHPFPAAIDDAYAALQWAAEHAAELGGDPARIVIAGESAGATLAAIAAQRARDENGPRLAAQVLLYPPIHPTADTESRRLFPHGPVVGVAAVTQMWELYLGDLALQDSPLASPRNASSLEGLPPALVLTAEIDPTRDEAEAYGHALAAAGVPTEVKRLDGFIHATLNLGGYVPRTREIYEAINSFLAAHGQTAGSGAATGIR